MKKTLFIFAFLFLFTSTEAFAQFYMSTARSFTRTKFNSSCIGVKGGVNFSTMRYTDKYLSQLHQSVAVRPIGGIFVDFRISNWFYICPEVATVSRGLTLTYPYFYDNEYTVSYMVDSRYLSLRIPLMFKISVSDFIQPYFFIAPDFGYNYGGTIRYTLTDANATVNEEQIPMGVSNMAVYNYAALGGIGIRFNLELQQFVLIVKTDLAYSYSFNNNFSSYEIAHYSTPVNINGEYDINGERFNKGLEFMVSIAAPIKAIKGKKTNSCPAF